MMKKLKPPTLNIQDRIVTTEYHPQCNYCKRTLYDGDIILFCPRSFIFWCDVCLQSQRRRPHRPILVHYTIEEGDHEDVKACLKIKR